MRISDLQNFNADRLEMIDLIELESLGVQLDEAFKRNGVDKPEWFDPQLTAVRREINAKNEDALLAQKKRLELQLDNLMTPDEKRQKVLDQLAKVNEKLTGKQTPVGA